MSSRHFTRRTVLTSIASGVCVGLTRGNLARALATRQGAWDAKWDSALLDAALRDYERSYDAEAHMVSAYHGDEYSYQSNVRNATVHPTRNSLEYASLLLYRPEKTATERALQIMDRMLSFQVLDPDSRYFGLWGWYMEEPPDKMHAADFNWADFNGATLLNILLEHEQKLPTALAAKCRNSLRACAISIRRRNVSLDYTNIAFQGTYVTLAAAELFKDEELLTYARDRISRLRAAVDISGSFAEYNSPTYMAVTIGNIARILHYVRDREANTAAAWLNARAWRHIAEHWHMPTMQLAGPMSRAYSNNIGAAMWIQKATDNRVSFLSFDEISRHPPGGEASIPTVPWHCPEESVAIMTSNARRQHREVFIPGRATDGKSITEWTAEKPLGATLPVEGTTLLTPSFCLGTIDRCDCWVQRRNLIAYWGSSSRPPRCLQLRVLKDDYEFTSAMFYSAQELGHVLGSVRFKLDGGDKHPSLDPIKDQTIALTRMRVELLFEGWESTNTVFVNGEPHLAVPFSVPYNSRIGIDAGAVKIVFQARYARFLDQAKTLEFRRNESQASLAVELIQPAGVQTVHLPDLLNPGCDFTFLMDDSGAPLEKVDASFAATRYAQEDSADTRRIQWQTESGELSLTTATSVDRVATLDQRFASTVDGKPYPFHRLAPQSI